MKQPVHGKVGAIRVFRYTSDGRLAHAAISCAGSDDKTDLPKHNSPFNGPQDKHITSQSHASDLLRESDKGLLISA